jgi:hypothetical protein
MNKGRTPVSLLRWVAAAGWLLSAGASVQAQPSPVYYAREIIDSLCSPSMNGRGYVDSGDWRAAKYISDQLKENRVQPAGHDFFQPVFFDVNVFPGKMNVKVEEKELVPGKDFILRPFSKEINGKFSLFLLRKDATDTAAASVKKLVNSIPPKKKRKTLLAVQRSDFTPKQFQLFQKMLDSSNCWGMQGCIEFTKEKLTAGVSTSQSAYTYLLVSGEIPQREGASARVEIDASLKKKYESRNVIGSIRGTAAPDSFIVFTAHYDHLGQMGDGTYFPGANDNASGTSLLLNLARHFSANPARYSIALIFFTGEELGLIGSSFFVENPVIPLNKIKFLINLDIVGTGDEGIKVVNATEFPSQFDQLVKLNEKRQYVKTVSPRGKAANSDHYPFYLKGVPCFFIYTLGGIAAYHDVYDRAETLPLTEYEDLYRLLIEFSGSF